MTKNSNSFETLKSYISDLYPDEPIPLQNTFSNYPHLQKLSELMIKLLNESISRQLQQDETKLIIRSFSILCAEMNDISLSDMQSDRVIRRKRLNSDATQEDADELREQLSELHRKTHSFEVEKQTYEKQVDSLKDELNKLKEKNGNLKKKFKELKRMKENEVSELTVEKESLGDLYASTLHELELETSKGQNLSGQIDTLLKDTNEKAESIEQLQQQIEKQQDLLRKAKSLLKGLENRAIRDKEYIKTLKDQLRIERSKIDNTQNSNQDSNTLQEENILLRERMIGLTESNEKNLLTINELVKANNEMAIELEKSRSQTDLTATPQSAKQTEQKSTQKKAIDNKTKTRQEHNKSTRTINQQPNQTNESHNKQQTEQEIQTDETLNEQELQNKDEEIDNKEIQNDQDSINDMKRSLNRISALFRKSNLRPSELPKISKQIAEQEILIRKFRSIIDAQVRFILTLINKDYAMPHILDEIEEENSEEEEINGCKTSTIFQNEQVLELIKESVEKSRQSVLDSLNGDPNGINEIILYESIFNPEETGIVLLIDEMEKKGADNEIAALAVLLSVILKQRKILESDAKFLQSIYDVMPLDFDHPQSAQKACDYINELHEKLQSLKKFFNREYSQLDGEINDLEFLELFVKKQNEFTQIIKKVAGHSGKLSDLPKSISVSQELNKNEYQTAENEQLNTQNQSKAVQKKSQAVKKTQQQDNQNQVKQDNQNQKEVQSSKQTTNQSNQETEQSKPSNQSSKQNQNQSNQETEQSKPSNKPNKNQSKPSNQSSKQTTNQSQSKQETDQSKPSNKQNKQNQNQSKQAPKERQINKDNENQKKQNTNSTKEEKPQKKENQKQKETQPKKEVNPTKENKSQKKELQPKKSNQTKPNSHSKKGDQNQNHQENHSNKDCQFSNHNSEELKEDDQIENIDSFSLSQNEIIERRTTHESNESFDNDSILGEHVDSYPTRDLEIQKLIDEKKKMKKEIKLLKRQLGDAKTAYEVLQDTFTHFHDKTAETNKDVMVIIEERDRLQKLLNERNQMFDKRLKKNIDYLTMIKDSEMETMKKRYEEEIRILNKKLNSYHKRIKEIKQSTNEISELYEDVLRKQQKELKQLKKGSSSASAETNNGQSQQIKELQDKIADLIMMKSADVSLSILSNSANTTFNTSNIQSPLQNKQVEQNTLNEIGKSLAKILGLPNSSIGNDSLNNASDHSFSPISTPHKWTKEKIIETIESLEKLDAKKNDEIDWRRWAYDILARYGKIDVSFDDLKSVEMRHSIKSMIDSSASRLKLMDKIDSLRAQKQLLLEGNVDVKQVKKKKVSKNELDLQTMKSAMLVILATEAIIHNANKAKLKKPQPSLSNAASPRPLNRK